MRAILRQWASFAALGAGLIHIALGAGSPLGTAIVLVGVGAAELAWAIAVLARGRILATRSSITAAIVLVAVWIAAIVAGGGFGIDPLPMLAAVMLDLAVAALVVADGRSAGAEREPRAGRMVLGAFVGALLVAGLATPALAATPAGGGDMGGMHDTGVTVPSGHQHG